MSSHGGNYSIYAEIIDKKDTEWYDEAACAGTDTEAFFPVDRGSSYPEEVKRTCKSCNVQADCLNFALKYHTQGFWGGTTEQERRRMNRYGLKAKSTR